MCALQACCLVTGNFANVFKLCAGPAGWRALPALAAQGRLLKGNSPDGFYFAALPRRGMEKPQRTVKKSWPVLQWDGTAGELGSRSARCRVRVRWPVSGVTATAGREPGRLFHKILTSAFKSVGASLIHASHVYVRPTPLCTPVNPGRMRKRSRSLLRKLWVFFFSNCPLVGLKSPLDFCRGRKINKISFVKR